MVVLITGTHNDQTAKTGSITYMISRLDLVVIRPIFYTLFTVKL